MTGIFTIIPIVVTLFIIFLVLKFLNSILILPFSGLLKLDIPWVQVIVPIAGLIISLFTICGIGFLTANIMGKRLFLKIERLFSKVPVVKSIYTSIKQISEILFVKGKASFTRVVMIEYPRKGVYSIGFVSSEENKKISKEINKEVVNLYLPTAFNIASGFLLVVPVEETTPLDISVEEGLKLVISGGIISPVDIKSLDNNGGNKDE